MLCVILLAATAGCGTTVVEAADAGAAASIPQKTFAVTAYGAKGDGIADDAPALQAAIAAAGAAGGGVVTVPCGEFALLSLQGAAPGKRSALYESKLANISISGQGRCSHLFTTLPQTTVLEFSASTNITLSQLRLTALNRQYVETYGFAGGSAVRFTGVAGGSITQVEVDGASAGSLYLTAGTTHIAVANNNIHDTMGAGIWEDDCGSANASNCLPYLASTNNTYDSNTLTNTTLAALSAIDVDESGPSNSVISNNTVSWTRQPIAGNNQVQCIQVNNASGVSVLNNTCTGSPWNGIVATTGPGAQIKSLIIKGNTITTSGTSSIGGGGIVIYNGPAGLGVSGFDVSYNTITTAADDGISLYADTHPGLVSNGTVTHNVVSLADQRTPGSHFGINVQYSASIGIVGNTISCNGKCIAAGVNFAKSTGAAPVTTANTVSNILGPALWIQ